ncbi:Thyroid hormone receptor-associated protein 3 [Vulpes lagopus]
MSNTNKSKSGSLTSRSRFASRSRSRSFLKSRSRSRSVSCSRKRRLSSRSCSRSYSPAHNRERNHPRVYQNRDFQGHNRGYRRPYYFRGRNKGFYPWYNRGGYGNYRSNGRTTGKHTVLVGPFPDPHPQREGPLHQGPGAILETPISLPLTDQGAPHPLILPPTTAEWNLLSTSLQRRNSPLPRVAGHLRLPGITKVMRPRSRCSLEAPLKIQKHLTDQNHGQMPPLTVLVLHHGPLQFLS